MSHSEPQTLIIACGAIAKELVSLIRLNRWSSHVTVQCLPAELHNRPDKIPSAVSAMIVRTQGKFDRTVVAYADCGTGGLLDKALQGTGIERLPGAHCYEFFAGAERFALLHDEEPGTLYLTDFLARHFERLIMTDMGINQHPELRDMLFGNYRRCVYLAQSDNPQYLELARQAAQKLGLTFEVCDTQLAPFNAVLAPLLPLIPIQAVEQVA